MIIVPTRKEKRNDHLSGVPKSIPAGFRQSCLPYQKKQVVIPADPGQI
jgi:hypothetical protein